MSKLKYQRILLKVSGEALADQEGRGVDFAAVDKLITEISPVHDLGVQIAIVLGGGNFWRYRDFKESGIPRVASDQIGMLATTMNAMTLSNTLNTQGMEAQMYCAFAIESVIPKYQIFDARSCLAKNKVVILAGGTGHPFFTTDTTAALRASELECDVVLKATKVDGVYDTDPEKNSDAKKFQTLSYQEAIEKELRVMDQTAFSLCQQNSIPLIVFDGFTPGNLKKIVQGEQIGTLVS